MTDDIEGPCASPDHGTTMRPAPVSTSASIRRRFRGHRRLRITVGILVLVLLGFVAWFGVNGYRAQAELTAAKDHAQQAKTALLRADGATAQREVNLAVADAGAARANTHSVPWDIAKAIPVVGQPFDAAAQISAAVDDLALEVLRPAVSAGAALAPGTLRRPDGAINLDAMVSARAPLQRATAAAAKLTTTVHAIPAGGYLHAVDSAREQLQAQTSQLGSLLNNANDAATLLPPMLGADGPRNYFVAFQTNAEARATGGLVGSFGILHAEHGHISMAVTGSGSNADLIDQPNNPFNLGSEFAQQGYIGDSTRAWGNSNISANFPYVAQIWASLWQLQTGQHIDGALATDPVALSYTLNAIGPLTLPDGETLDAGNFVQFTESKTYVKFPGLDGADRNARKDYQQSISRELAAKFFSGSVGNTGGLLRALGKGAGEGRLAVWSAHPPEQAILVGTPLAREVPDNAAPYAGLIVNNASHGKLDYYLGRTLNYTAGACTGLTRHSTVTATLTNNAPAQGLPPFVTIGSPPAAVGSNGTFVSLYATAGARLEGVSVNGVPVKMTPGTERGHPVFTVPVEMAPGATATVKYALTEPTAAGPAQLPVQPLVLPMDVTSDVPICTAGN